EKVLKVATEARQSLRRQFIEGSLREGHYDLALAQLAAVIDEEPAAAWARALTVDLLLRGSWLVPLPQIFPDGPFTSMDCNEVGTRCAAAFRDGRVLVRGDLSRDLDSKQKGYAAIKMSRDGSRLLFVPEAPGDAVE